MMTYLFGHLGLLLYVLLLHGDQCSETGLHLEDGGSKPQNSECDTKKRLKDDIKLLGKHIQQCFESVCKCIMH